MQLFFDYFVCRLSVSLRQTFPLPDWSTHLTISVQPLLAFLNYTCIHGTAPRFLPSQDGWDTTQPLQIPPFNSHRLHSLYNQQAWKTGRLWVSVQEALLASVEARAWPETASLLVLSCNTSAELPHKLHALGKHLFFKGWTHISKLYVFIPHFKL